MLDWMVWTTPVAVFFGCVFLMLVGMTVWELRSPTAPRRGWLPIETTRGDRLFIGLMAMAWINLGFVGIAGRLQEWLALDSEPSIWISFAVSLGVLGLVLRKG